MGRKNKTSKAAEKKKERLALQKKMDQRVKFVKEANDCKDPLGQLPSFKKYNKNGLDIHLETLRVGQIEKEEQEWLIDLITRNMKDLYESWSG